MTLSASGLQKRYGARTVVKDVSLTVESGEVVGLLGPNGAGKTTSFYMIVGLVRADGGTITIDGQSVEHMPIHRRSRLGLSYLPQEASIFRKLNVADNVRAVLELQLDEHGRPLGRRAVEERLTELLRTCGSTTCATRPPSPCPVASAGGWRSPAHWPRNRASSCWTSPSPASTRSRSSRSSASSASSSPAASGS